MKNNMHTDMSYLDILFEGKNKSYGAYTLRRDYNHRMRNAVIIMALSVTAILYSLSTAKSEVGHPDDEKVWDEIEVITLPKEKVQEIPTVQKTITKEVQVKTIKKTPPVIIQDRNTVVDAIPDDKKLIDHQIGAINSKGDPSDGRLGDFGHPNPGIVTDINKIQGTKSTTKNSNDDEIEVFVDQEASYPGGDDALIRDIIRNFKYPDIAQQQGITGILYISFVVEKDGTISRVKVKRGLGYGLDEAAVAAIKKLKKFTAARKDGKVVRSYFTAPINCQLSK